MVEPLSIRSDATVAEASAINAAAKQGEVLIRGDRVVRGGLSKIKESRSFLLPALHALQSESGWISPGGVGYISELLQVSEAEIYGVATFYDLFRTDRPIASDYLAHVCVDPLCSMSGSEALLTDLRQNGQESERSACLGLCANAPAVFFQGKQCPDYVVGDGDSAPILQTISKGDQLLKRIGRIDPTSLSSYKDTGGFVALSSAIQMGSAAVINMVTESGLTGRGGAGFPTGAKWAAVAAESADVKYLVANADESEPGTFKDRVIMESDPFALIEAMTIGGVAVGAELGWIYIRAEYPLAIQRVAMALEEARGANLLGAKILGSNYSFDIELRKGAGAYICGEETALFSSIEGYRGEPRSKPPYPTTNGLFGRPTVVNNPETLVNVLEILTHGVPKYRSQGTPKSPGTKLYCVSGDVNEPGLYEAEFGVKINELISLAGGSVSATQAVLLGGAAGSLIAPEHFDLPLSTEEAQANGVSLGSGAVMVLGDQVDILDVIIRVAEFFKNESCGQCVPCRIGTMRQHEQLLQIKETKDAGKPDIELLTDIGNAMSDASICGLGHTASTAVQSAISSGLIWGSND
jgi:NADH-quinone oxidoreductase subunit F|tara:strand:- start:40128 stop:41870 length:1743 start_codon:yes stop_codon:yes gene_type:complete